MNQAQRDITRTVAVAPTQLATRKRILERYLKIVNPNEGDVRFINHLRQQILEIQTFIQKHSK